MIPGVPYDAEIEYLESTGTQYIDTVVSGAEHNLVITARICINTFTTYAGGFGNYKSESANCYRTILTGSNNGQAYMNCGYITSSSHVANFQLGSWHTVILNGVEDRCFCDGVEYSKDSRFRQGSENSSPIILFTSGGAAAGTWSKQIASFAIELNGVLIRDFIPVRVGQTGYMYDRVTKRLFGNKGTGSFVLGPDVAKPVMGLYGMRKFYNARDYVQDGLIAQWDVDGGQLLSDTSFVTCVNYAQTLWTCEILVLPSTLTSCVVKWASNNYPTLYTSNGYPVNAVYTGSKYYSGYNRAPNPAGAVWSDTNVSFGNGTGHYYKNGVKVGEYTVPGNMTQNSHVVNISTNPAKLINYLASVRIYNRALSPAEIAHNYAIDKARFNLP